MILAGGSGVPEPHGITSSENRLQFAHGDAEREGGGSGCATARGERRRQGGHDADDGPDEDEDGHPEERGVESRDEESG